MQFTVYLFSALHNIPGFWAADGAVLVMTEPPFDMKAASPRLTRPLALKDIFLLGPARTLLVEPYCPTIKIGSHTH